MSHRGFSCVLLKWATTLNLFLHLLYLKFFFCRNVGMLNVEGGTSEKLKGIINSLMSSGEDFQVFLSDKLKDKYPELRFSTDYTAVLEQAAGILKADKCLRALQVNRIWCPLSSNKHHILHSCGLILCMMSLQYVSHS